MQILHQRCSTPRCIDCQMKNQSPSSSFRKLLLFLLAQDVSVAFLLLARVPDHPDTCCCLQQCWSCSCNCSCCSCCHHNHHHCHLQQGLEGWRFGFGSGFWTKPSVCKPNLEALCLVLPSLAVPCSLRIGVLSQERPFQTHREVFP